MTNNAIPGGYYHEGQPRNWLPLSVAFTVAGSKLYINSGISAGSPWLAPLVGYAPFEALMRPRR